MRFFLDNCMSPHHAAGLSAFSQPQRIEIVHLKVHFDEATPDVEWIHTIGQQGDWVIISGDLRITRNRVERQAWIESGLTAFFFADAWSRKEYWKKAADLIAWWPNITRTARAHPKGHGFLIPNGGRELKQIYPETGSRR